MRRRKQIEIIVNATLVTVVVKSQIGSLRKTFEG
jgi:hypothetical protein